MKIIPCPLCGAKEYNELYHFTEKKPPFMMVDCADCKLTYMNPRPTNKEIRAYYTDEGYFSGEADYSYKDEREDEVSLWILSDSILKSIERKCEIGKMLDIGCSFGNFLFRAGYRGWQTYGVDVSPEAIDWIKHNSRIDGFCGEVEHAPLEVESFDCITMFETIEHLTDPLKTVKHCYKLLKKNGLLVIQTGNINSLYAKITGRNNNYFLPGHLVYFSERTLKRLLEEAGFKGGYVYAGDNISYFARMAYIFSTNTIKWRHVPFQWLKWTAFYMMRAIVRNRPVLGSITIYARK